MINEKILDHAVRYQSNLLNIGAMEVESALSVHPGLPGSFWVAGFCSGVIRRYRYLIGLSETF